MFGLSLLVFSFLLYIRSAILVIVVLTTCYKSLSDILQGLIRALAKQFCLVLMATV